MKVKLFNQTTLVAVTISLITASSLAISTPASAQERAIFRAGKWVIENAPDWFPRRKPRKLPQQIPPSIRNTIDYWDNPRIPIGQQCRLGRSAGRIGYDGPLPRGAMELCRDVFKKRGSSNLQF